MKLRPSYSQRALHFWKEKVFAVDWESGPTVVRPVFFLSSVIRLVHFGEVNQPL